MLLQEKKNGRARTEENDEVAFKFNAVSYFNLIFESLEIKSG